MVTGYRWLERLVWLVLVSFHLGMTVYMGNLNLEDARANPVMTTIDTVDVTNVPFPAVTVLPGEMAMVFIVLRYIYLYLSRGVPGRGLRGGRLHPEAAGLR